MRAYLANLRAWYNYVPRLRMARARELLLVSTQSGTEIAAAVGVADPFYFARRFRPIHGCSPTQFRQYL